MNHDSQLIREGDAIYLQGQVGFQTVNGLFKSLRHELTPEVKTLDCSRVGVCDSSAISLLLASRTLAQERKIQLSIRGMNEQMQSLARLYEVESMLV